MSVQVKRRREAAAFLATYVGAQGELLVDTTNNRVQVHDGATSGGWPAAGIGDLPGRNAIVNGSFAVNQRGTTSGVSLAAGAYGHDRWKAGAGGGSYTFAQSLPDTLVTITAGTLVQAIEAGNVVAAAWWLTWTGTATARVWQGSAAGGFAPGTARIIAGNTVNTLLVSGLTPGAVASVEFATGTLGLVQLEAALPGAGPTRFERRPFASELTLCQRYFRTIGSAYTSCAAIGLWNSSSQARVGATWRGCSMRAAPTFLLVGSAGGWTVDAQGTSINLATLTLFGADAESATFLAGIPSTGVQGVQSQGTMMMGNNSAGIITLSAEL